MSQNALLTEIASRVEEYPPKKAMMKNGRFSCVEMW